MTLSLTNNTSSNSSVDNLWFIYYTFTCAHEFAGAQCTLRGSLAQLGEHLPYKQGVTGSSPVVPTKKFNTAQ